VFVDVLPGFPIEVGHDRDVKYTLEPRVENKGSKDLYVCVYNLGPQWQVQNILRGSYEVIPSRQTDLGFSGVFELRTLIPTELLVGGQVDCKSIFKVVVTSQPTTFYSLELPKVATAVRREEGSDTGRNNRWLSSADWAALNFPVHTHIKESN
jgi:hypothetical protein